MASFTYSARDKAGAISQGRVSAADRAAAGASLMGKGLVPILIKDTEAAAPSKRNGLFKSGNKVKAADLVIFSRQFATMINAGVPISQALSILGEQSASKKLQHIVGDIASQVDGGSSLANALGTHPEVFNSIYVNMVKAGETGGILDQVLDRLATQQEKDAETVAKVKSASIYPAVVFSFTMIVFVFLMTVIIPKLSGVFLQLGVTLPIYTRILLATSRFFLHDGIYIIIGLAIAAYLFRRYIKTPKGKHTLDVFVLKAPIVGPISRKVNVARFARTFGSLMSSGISVLDALKATGDSLGNSVYREELAKLAQAVKNGRPISETLKESPYFPAIVSQMTSVGEETGKLDEILIKLAEFYEKEVDNVVAGLTSIIEPILIIILGAMVGMVVISVFGPLASLNQGVSS